MTTEEILTKHHTERATATSAMTTGLAKLTGLTEREVRLAFGWEPFPATPEEKVEPAVAAKATKVRSK